MRSNTFNAPILTVLLMLLPNHNVSLSTCTFNCSYIYTYVHTHTKH